MTNLFAFRATEPENMRRAKEPVGEWNDDTLDITASGAGLIVLAWGCMGDFQDRDKRVLRLIEPHVDKVRFLDVTIHGHFPRHPLYLKDSLKLVEAKPFWKNFLQRG